jgi:non-homologous end joining protein Ku
MAATAEWTGVIVVGPFELDCRLFSAFGRAKPFPIRFLHKNCHTVLEEVQPEKSEEEKPRGKLPGVQVREQFFCPKCQKPLRADEIGQGIETTSGIVEISEADIAALRFEPKKQLTAELILADDPTIEAIGVGRRLYILPKPAAVDIYANIYYLLRESKRFGFISPLVIKGKPNVAILRPLTIPSVIFGVERRVLVLDILNDTDCLKDPAEIPDYPAFLPDLNLAILARPLAEAQEINKKLNPERCINPKRLRLKEIIRRAIECSLRK